MMGSFWIGILKFYYKKEAAACLGVGPCHYSTRPHNPSFPRRRESNFACIPVSLAAMAKHEKLGSRLRGNDGNWLAAMRRNAVRAESVVNLRAHPVSFDNLT
jgi:hypothetical protein